MKSTIQSLPFVVGLLVASLFMANCQDDSYYKDGGTHNAHYDGTVLEYLQNFPDTNYFRTLLKVIDMADMEEVLQNEDVTFFVPTDWSIDKSVGYLSNYLYRRLGRDSIKDLRQIKPEVWKEFLSLYIVKDKYLLKDIPQMDTTALSAYPGQAYYSYGGVPMNMGVIYADANGVKYAGPRQVVYSYIYDFTEQILKNAYVATCDIQPVNGAIHVIRFTDHNFGFDVQTFAQKAINVGITPLEQLEKEEKTEPINKEEKR